MILIVTNKALEGLNMVNPRLSIHGVVRSGEYDRHTFPFYCPGGAVHDLRNREPPGDHHFSNINLSFAFLDKKNSSESLSMVNPDMERSDLLG